MSERCQVCLNDFDCEIYTSKKCFACGNAACGGCSKIALTYYRFKRKRICNDCQEDHAGSFVLAVPRAGAGGRGGDAGDALDPSAPYHVQRKRIGGKPVTILTGCAYRFRVTFPGGHAAMTTKIRLTNNSEIDLDQISAVFLSPSLVYRVVMKDGSAKQYRRVLLTEAGREALDTMVAGG